jgi:hypothetical protein
MELYSAKTELIQTPATPDCSEGAGRFWTILPLCGSGRSIVKAAYIGNSRRDPHRSQTSFFAKGSIRYERAEVDMRSYFDGTWALRALRFIGYLSTVPESDDPHRVFSNAIEEPVGLDVDFAVREFRKLHDGRA